MGTVKVYGVQEGENGLPCLGMMPRPRGGENLDADIKDLKKQGVDHLVCLLEDREMNSLGLEQEEACCMREQLNLYCFPIPDYGVPPEINSFLSLINWMDEEISCQKKIVVHCHGGIGRSSLVIAGLLLKRGMPFHLVFPTISQARGNKTPETNAQLDWILSLSNSFYRHQ